MGITCHLCPCWNYTCKFKCSMSESTRIGGCSVTFFKCPVVDFLLNSLWMKFSALLPSSASCWYFRRAIPFDYRSFYGFFTWDLFSRLCSRISSISLHFLHRTCYEYLKWWHLKHFTDFFFLTSIFPSLSFLY